MTRPEAVVITDEAVIRALANEVVVDALEEAFRLAGRGQAIAGMRAHYDVPRGEFHVVSGGVRFPDGPFVVTKVNGRLTSGEGSAATRTVRGAVLVSSADDGAPVALIASGSLTTIRTGGVAALAVRHLAPPDADRLLIVGTGRVARECALALSRSGRFGHIGIAGRNHVRRDALVEQLNGEITQDVAAVELDSALGSVDVVVTATASEAPLFDARLVRPGTTIVALGADRPGKQELPVEVVGTAGVVTDLTSQCLISGELQYSPEVNVRAELGDVVAGRIVGRCSPEEVVVVDVTGSAIADAAAVRLVLQAEGVTV